MVRDWSRGRGDCLLAMSAIGTKRTKWLRRSNVGFRDVHLDRIANGDEAD